MKKILIIVLASIIGLSSCEGLLDNLEEQGLTEEEVVDGLKTALRVGTDSSSVKLSAVDGYYRDELVKILLPPEAEIIREYKDHEVMQMLGLDEVIDSLITEVVLRMNRSAENAAEKAQPIFVNAITDMTIEDGMNILKENDTAATHYLRENTYSSLREAYQPDVEAALAKDLVGGVSTQEVWDKLTSKYNKAANSTAGVIAGLEPVDTELDDYVTTRALNGLFMKIKKEEAEIREDPYQWSLDILQRVFGEES